MKQLSFSWGQRSRPSNKYTREQRDRWAAEYREGKKSFREIGEPDGAPAVTVCWYVKKVVKLNDKRPRGRKNRYGLPPKEVQRQNNLRKYGLTLEAYDNLLTSQNGVCAICGALPRGGRTASARLHVDHDHRTKKVRGLLCQKCNPAIGQFSDRPELLERAANYIRDNV